MTNAEIRPFHVQVPQADLDDLRDRLSRTRWPDEPPGVGWSRGVPLGYLQDLTEYWASSYDWRKEEARINELPQFVTTIDGQDIHFLQVESPEPGAFPLLLSHSYPGSFVELVELIGPLTDPRAHGGDPADAFHVVVPSIPGFGFSRPVTETGWTSTRTAHAWVELMRRLGYARYGAHGGDIGAGINGELGGIAGDAVAAVHVTTDPQTIVTVSMFSGGGEGENPHLSEAQNAQLQQMRHVSGDGLGYIQLQSTRPQTLAYLLNDTPVGQLAWIVEKFKEWTAASAELPEDAVDRDQLLTNVSVYWFTGTGASAAQHIYENMHAERDWSGGSAVPTGFALFAADPIARPLFDPEGEIEHWSEFEAGGHFPAMEVPDLLAGDIRSFFRSYR